MNRRGIIVLHNDQNIHHSSSICYFIIVDQCELSLVPFIVVHTNAALNDLLELWDFDFVETVRFNSL